MIECDVSKVHSAHSCLEIHSVCDVLCQEIKEKNTVKTKVIRLSMDRALTIAVCETVEIHHFL